MTNKYLSPHQKNRVNPQYKDVTQMYSSTHKQLKELNHFKDIKQKQLNYTEKNNLTLSDTLNRKIHQLRWLKDVRKRHLRDVTYKLERQDFLEQQIEELHQRSWMARSQNRRNISEALSRTKRQKTRVSQQVKSQLQEIKNIKHMKKQQNQILSQIRTKQKQQLKLDSQQKINSFFRHKNKQLLNNYKQMIKNQQDQAQKSYNNIQRTLQTTQRVDHRMKNKKLKLKSIQQQIANLKQQEKKDINEAKISYRTKTNRTCQEFNRDGKTSCQPYDLIMKEMVTSGSNFASIDNDKS